MYRNMKTFQIGKSTIFVGLVFALWQVTCYAQLGGRSINTPFQVNIIPPSPEASSLAEYADIPVSLYTGTPDITIPLYELQERDLRLPIAVRYHASGHKVEDEASRVGLGWSLHASGVITRSLRGLPDEYGPRGFLHQAAEMRRINEENPVGAYALGLRDKDMGGMMPWQAAVEMQNPTYFISILPAIQVSFSLTGMAAL